MLRANPSLHLTCVDLETHISRSSVFKWGVVTKWSVISAHIKWGANREQYAAGSNPSS